MSPSTLKVDPPIRKTYDTLAEVVLAVDSRVVACISNCDISLPNLRCGGERVVLGGLIKKTRTTLA